MPEDRKPVAMTTYVETTERNAYRGGIDKVERRHLVVCDDGAVFLWLTEVQDWREMPPVPGTAHARGGMINA